LISNLIFLLAYDNEIESEASFQVACNVHHDDKAHSRVFRGIPSSVVLWMSNNEFGTTISSHWLTSLITGVDEVGGNFDA
jgi:hypothetical protein